MDAAPLPLKELGLGLAEPELEVPEPEVEAAEVPLLETVVPNGVLLVLAPELR